MTCCLTRRDFSCRRTKTFLKRQESFRPALSYQYSPLCSAKLNRKLTSDKFLCRYMARRAKEAARNWRMVNKMSSSHSQPNPKTGARTVPTNRDGRRIRKKEVLAESNGIQKKPRSDVQASVKGPETAVVSLCD